MADINKLITMTEKGSISGPYYDVYYSTDCISYTLAVDGNDVYLPTVGSTAVVTVPDGTTCIKLVSTGPNCTNDVIVNIGTTTTTIPPTTTTTTTTTCLASGSLTEIQIGWDINSSGDACNFQQTANVWVVRNPPECGDYIYRDHTGCTKWGYPEQAAWVAWGNGYSYTFNYGTGQITCSSIFQCSSFTTTTTTTTTTSTTVPTTSTTTTTTNACVSCDEYLIENYSQIPGDTLTIEYIDCNTGLPEEALIPYDSSGYVCSCSEPTRIGGPTSYAITNEGPCATTTTSTTAPTTSTTTTTTGVCTDYSCGDGYQYYTTASNDYEIYPDVDICASSNECFSIAWDAIDRPNRFSVYDSTGLIWTSGWVGQATWPGYWGPSLNTPTSGTTTIQQFNSTSGRYFRVEAGNGDPLNPSSDAANWAMFCQTCP